MRRAPGLTENEHGADARLVSKVFFTSSTHVLWWDAATAVACIMASRPHGRLRHILVTPTANQEDLPGLKKLKREETRVLKIATLFLSAAILSADSLESKVPRIETIV